MSGRERLARAIKEFEKQAKLTAAQDYCSKCGMFPPRHWPGCPRGKKMKYEPLARKRPFPPRSRVEAADHLATKATEALEFLGNRRCSEPFPDCRPGACNCDGMQDALRYAVDLYWEQVKK